MASRPKRERKAYDFLDKLGMEYRFFDHPNAEITNRHGLSVEIVLGDIHEMLIKIRL